MSAEKDVVLPSELKVGKFAEARINEILEFQSYIGESSAKYEVFYLLVSLRQASTRPSCGTTTSSPSSSESRFAQPQEVAQETPRETREGERQVGMQPGETCPIPTLHMLLECVCFTFRLITYFPGFRVP